MHATIREIIGYKAEINTDEFDQQLFEKYLHTYIVNGQYTHSGTYSVEIITDEGERIKLLVNHINPALILPECEIHLRLADYQGEEIPSFWLNGLINPKEEADDDEAEREELYKLIREFHKLSYSHLSLPEAIYRMVKEISILEPNEVFYALENIS